MRQGVPRATSSGHRALSITHAVVGRGASFFFMAEYDSAAWASHTRAPPRAPAGGRLAECASERAAVAGARIPGSSGYLRRSGIAGRFATLNLRSCQTVLHASCRLASPPAGREGPAFLPPLAPARLLDAGPRGGGGCGGAWFDLRLPSGREAEHLVRACRRRRVFCGARPVAALGLFWSSRFLVAVQGSPCVPDARRLSDCDSQTLFSAAFFPSVDSARRCTLVFNFDGLQFFSFSSFHCWCSGCDI